MLFHRRLRKIIQNVEFTIPTVGVIWLRIKFADLNLTKKKKIIK